MNLKLIVSILEIIYLSYMFHFCETRIDFNFLSSPEGSWFKHLIGNNVGLRICPFGRYAIVLLLIILFMRNYIFIPRDYIAFALVIAVSLSFMNMNAFVFLLPVIFVEFFTYFYGYGASF